MNIVAQACSIVIMFILMYFYYTAKKLPLYTGKAFMGMWSLTLYSLIMDVFSLVVIKYQDYLPWNFVAFICKAYLASLVWMALFALRYVCVDIFNRISGGKIWSIRIHIYGFLTTILIFALPFEIVGADTPYAYTDGPSVIATYVFNVIVLIVILNMVIRHRNEIVARRREAVSAWVVVIIIAAAIQFFFNQYLLIGFASVLGILIMFLKQEDPEMNLERESGLFNLNGFHMYLKQKQGNSQDVSIICISYDNNRSGGMSYELEKMVNSQIIDFLESIPRCFVFQSSEYEFILVFDDEADAEIAISMIDKRFDMPWGADHMRMISKEWFYIERTDNIHRTEDVLPIFQYAKQNRENATADGMRIQGDLIEKMYEEREMENEIVQALNDGRVEVFYQPIYSIKNKKFASAEALVRIRDEKGEIIPPVKFIDIAEKRGLIIRLGECVFEQVCKFLVDQKPIQYGLEYIEVNLSVVQCGYEHLADDFIEIMNRYRVEPQYIVLEITESASIKEKKVLLENMSKLKRIGVRFALDDFGTGQSNLNYIVEMPVDVVKFDSSMTNAYFENGTAKYVMDAAMHMIQGMELEIVSEGIEEKNQYRTMKELGIDYIQGYYFSKPVDETSFVSFIKEKSSED